MQRPHGFHDFIKKEGFHSIYLISTETGNPMKVGIAADPVDRFNSIQSSNFLSLRLHRYWWMPGRKLTVRIENAFKEQFQNQVIRGEWFDLPLPTAENFIETSIRDLNSWGVRHSDIVGIMDSSVRRKFDIPAEAPTPLRGIATMPIAKGAR